MKHFILSGMNFVGRPPLFVTGLLLAFLLTASLPTYSQTQPAPQNTAEGGNPSRSRRLSQPNDLANENYEHLAAAPRQIQEVLLKDPGLLVELKRLAIKEATDNGQIVEDSSLTDQAIFERLEQDVKFRSLATRLVQRYGYLLPSFNPESEIAKQRDFVLKERARRQVQVEEREDAVIDAEIKKQAESIAAADNCVEQDCGITAPRKTPRRGSAAAGGTPEEIPDRGNSIPPLPLSSSSPVLRADSGASSVLGGGDTGLGSEQLSSLRADRQDQRATPGAAGEDSASENRASRIAQMFGASQGFPEAGGDIGPSIPQGLSPGAVSTDRTRPQDSWRNGSDRTRPSVEARRNAAMEFSPVSMVHRSNPYADIPSLYDMYVQASSKQLPIQRFGLDVLRNEDTDLNDFPIDLPAGPDYMVGPGEGPAVDLWGGVAQRISRTVDRQGRISLPESGPILVSGHTLAEVQQ